MFGRVYLITNLINGKKYVGQTRGSLARRWRQHVHKAKKGSRLAVHCAIRKYGRDQFTIECIEEVSGIRADLVAAEIRLIAAHESLAPKGYNLALGGEGFDVDNPEMRQRHLEGVRRSAATESWRAAQAIGARKRTDDPGWRASNLAALRALHASPEWQVRHMEVLRQLHADPEMQVRYRAGIERRSDNSAWRQSNSAVLAEARAKRTAAARARDAQCTPEEAMRRAQNRACNARYRARRRAARVSSCAATPVDG